MPHAVSLPADPDRQRAARRSRSTLPSAPWVETMFFVIVIAGCVSGGF